MNAVLQEGWWAYALVILVGVLPTSIWRWLGLLFAKNLHDGSEVFIWVKCVATALVASIIAKLIFFPFGALSDAPLVFRVLGAGLGFLSWYFLKRKILAGILVSQVVLWLGWRSG